MRRNCGGGDWVGERDDRDSERIRWGVEWLGAWISMENGGAKFPHTRFDPLNGRESLEESNGGGKNPTVIRG
jgi:hypothetical protein